MKLLKTFRKLITEVVARDEVVRAIQQKQVVTIYYDGDEPNGVGYRTIEPVCLGELNKSNGTTVTLLRAWDIEGASQTAASGEQPLPGWRLFNLNKIVSWNPTGENFDQPRPNYNFTGDKTLSRVIINAKF